MNKIRLSKSLDDKSKEEIIDKYIELYESFEKVKKEKERLEKELHKYKNAHTPSSQRRFEKVQALGLKVGRKKGKKSHHKGKTRKKEKPNIVIEVTTDKNPSNGSTNIKPLGYFEEFTVVDFEIKKIVKLFKCRYYEDLDTGEVFYVKHLDIPDKGLFGKNISSVVNFLRWKCRVPFDKIAFASTQIFNIPMSAPTAMKICNRAADKASPYYERLKANIKKEKAVNGDETGAKRNGLPGWLWGFFSLTIALFVFNVKRGGDVIKNVLGDDFKGILGCDGWSTYATFSKEVGILLQRCWAHAIRELKEICYKKKKPDKSLIKSYEWLCEIFEKVKEARRYKSQEIREQLYVELVDELNMWIQVYKPYRRLRKFVNKMEKAENFWFTCVLHLEIEPTNNKAERGIRPWRILEKIIGCLRSEQGFRTTEIMMSLFSTWDLRNINPYEQLKAIV